MTTRQHQILSGVLCVLLLVHMLLVNSLSRRLEELELQTDAIRADLKREQSLVRGALQEMNDQLTDGMEEIQRLRLILIPEEAQDLRRKYIRDLARLKHGLYTLTRSVKLRKRGGGEYEQEVTIYHMKVDIGSGSSKTTINLGLATSGISTIPLFYLDYDGDVTVDQDMMFEFVHFIPFGRLIGKSMDPQNSQAVYDAFLHSHREAAFTPVEEIQESSGKLVGGLWKFVQEQSGAIIDWIQEKGAEEKKSEQRF